MTRNNFIKAIFAFVGIGDLMPRFDNKYPKAFYMVAKMDLNFVKTGKIKDVEEILEFELIALKKAAIREIRRLNKGVKND